MKLGDPSEISKIQQVIRRILAELERLFHNLHCHFKTMDTQGFKNFTRQSYRSRCSAASSSD
jgi:Ni,Fe-hydrogenase III large subunit